MAGSAWQTIQGHDLHGLGAVAALKHDVAQRLDLRDVPDLHGLGAVAALKRLQRGSITVAEGHLHGLGAVAALKRPWPCAARGWAVHLHGLGAVAALKHQMVGNDYANLVGVSTALEPWPH